MDWMTHLRHSTVTVLMTGAGLTHELKVQHRLSDVTLVEVHQTLCIMWTDVASIGQGNKL